ncbi:hypothetical protein QQS21_008251 [Conoideocrella luteorostrata]|uniref:Secreted protein n=1 Tax=Conoideocrella luteorostrata TaxID=1105319 RepID=A0AAJ0CK22_9HYPO|nr:hypothetical protein QQS21_008251 [Conoideocrella luteorostrata]
MLFLTIIISLLTLAAHPCQGDEQPFKQSQVDRIVKSLETQLLNINSKSLPYYDSSSRREATCIQNMYKCPTTRFWSRHFLTIARKATIKQIRHADATFANDGSEKADLKSSKSTARLSSTTKGWQIAAKIGTGSPSSVAGDVSGQFKYEWTESNTKTETVEYTGRCPAGKTCTIETITFQATIEGYCMEAPLLYCGWDIDLTAQNVCVAQGEVNSLQDTCGQYKSYIEKARKEICPSSSARKRCQVDVPVLDASNEVFRVVAMTEKD